jgi:hypothetical protein
MNDFRLDMGACLLGLALVGACGDDDEGDTGNDTQTQTNSESASMTASDSGSSSSSASASMTDSATTTATETGTAESGDTSSDTATASATLTDTVTVTESSGSESGSSTAEDSGSSSSGGLVCSAEDESCADGMPCCDGLDCCSGQPIPPGNEYCTAGICPISDRNKKENFAAVDPRDVLAKVAALPITSWNYTFEDAKVRHIGPMAQDFKAAFGVGASDKSIFQVDADGVVLASVQALHGELEVLQKENDELRERLVKLEKALAKRGGR